LPAQNPSAYPHFYSVRLKKHFLPHKRPGSSSESLTFLYTHTSTPNVQNPLALIYIPPSVTPVTSFHQFSTYLRLDIPSGIPVFFRFHLVRWKS